MSLQFAHEHRFFIVRPAAAVTGSALPLRFARAAEFNMKLATTIPPDHPFNAHARAAAKAVAEQSGGRVNIEVFPGYVLGSSTSALSQLRGGGMQLLTLSGSVLSTLVPAATIYNTAVAFKDYDQVWLAMDGALGDHIRSKVSAVGLDPIGKHWDLGFRNITTSAKPIKTPEYLRDLKIPVPVAPLVISCFKAVESAPTPLNFDEVYSALQTRLIDGQENDVNVTETAKLYEVQKSHRANDSWRNLARPCPRCGADERTRDRSALGGRRGAAARRHRRGAVAGGTARLRIGGVRADHLRPSCCAVTVDTL